MKTTINIIEMRDEKDFQEIKKEGSFIVGDIAGAVKELETQARIVQILSYEGTQEEKKESILNIIENITNNDICNYNRNLQLPTIICTTGHISKKEFPEDKYYLEERFAEDGKELIPAAAILEREDKLLTDLGFVSINDYVNYEWQIAYIYPNKIGKKIVEIFNKE